MPFAGRDSGRQQLTTPTSIEFSQLPSLGKSLRYAREDHSHGMADDSVVAHVAEADPHTQYLKLAGRAGGQIAKGGTAAGEDLTLLSTAHATKGDVYLGGDGTTHRSVVESDGTLRFDGDATVWKDVMFPMAPPKSTGAGNPTLTTYNGNMRCYAFAVNDAHDFDPQEMTHDSKVGSTATWHLHFLSRSNDGTDRTLKWRLEYAIEPASGALPAPTTVDIEYTIPTGTAVNTVWRENVATFTIPDIARLAYARISRIASSGTEPATDPILSALHFHYEIDTVGSRQITTK